MRARRFEAAQRGARRVWGGAPHLQTGARRHARRRVAVHLIVNVETPRNSSRWTVRELHRTRPTQDMSDTQDTSDTSDTQDTSDTAKRGARRTWRGTHISKEVRTDPQANIARRQRACRRALPCKCAASSDATRTSMAEAVCELAGQHVMHIIHHEEHTRGVHVAPIHAPSSR